MSHADDDPVIFKYESSHNISFHGKGESGYTRGEWRELSPKEQKDAIEEFIWTLVDVYVEDEDE